MDGSDDLERALRALRRARGVLAGIQARGRGLARQMQWSSRQAAVFVQGLEEWATTLRWAADDIDQWERDLRALGAGRGGG